MQDFPIPRFLQLPLAVSLGLSLLPWGKYVLYPFKIFTTWVHECCHALAVVLVGGSVTKITLSPDTSGTTHYQLPKSRLRLGLVASAGYLGASAVGCLLYVLSQSADLRQAQLFEFGLGALMLLSLLFWIRNLFGAVAILCAASGLIALGRLEHRHYCGPVFAFLAVQTGLNAALDIRTLFSLDPRARSDARMMQSLFLLPAWFWALLWLSLSVAMTLWTVQRTSQ